TGLLLTGLLLTGCGPGSEPENRLAVAIWIGDEPITVDTFRQRVETTLKTCFIEQQFTDEEYALIVDQTIRDLVREKVIREKAAEMGIRVDPGDYTVVPDTNPDYPEGFEALTGLEKEWRGRIQDRMESMILASEIAGRMASGIVIDDEMLQTQYRDTIDQYTRPESLDLQVIRVYDQDLAEDISKKLKSGWKFSRLAEIYSNIRGEGAAGNIFRRERGEFSVPFESKLMELKPGQITEVLTSQEGYFIYRVEKKYPATVLPFEEVKDRLREEYRSRAETRIFQEWLDGEIQTVNIRMGTPLPSPGGEL
ncbi:MAG TPA: peptidyl-prolyl cis-trans isomerase, partial [bacterium]|nr:peptidyl-prolyl cis-trans isomerase [bacterium]